MPQLAGLQIDLVDVAVKRAGNKDLVPVLLEGLIRGAIIHHHNIPFIETLGLDTGNGLAKQCGAIVGGDYNGDLHILFMLSGQHA